MCLLSEVMTVNKKQTDYWGYLRFGGALKFLKTDIPENTPIMCNGRVVGNTTGENSINRPVNCVLYPHALHNEEMPVQNGVSVNDYEVVSLEIKND